MRLDRSKDIRDLKLRGSHKRGLHISAMRLLAAGALCAAMPAAAVDVSNVNEFGAALNGFDENIILTQNIDLLGQTFILTVAETQFFGDTTPRTLSNGTIIVTTPALLNLSTDIIFTGDITLTAGADLDIDAPAFLGAGGTVTANEESDIRLFTFDGDTNASFVGNPGTSFNIEGSDQDDVYGMIGSGLSVEINERWDMHFDLDFQVGSEIFSATLMGGLSYNF